MRGLIVKEAFKELDTLLSTCRPSSGKYYKSSTNTTNTKSSTDLKTDLAFWFLTGSSEALELQVHFPCVSEPHLSSVMDKWYSTLSLIFTFNWKKNLLKMLQVLSTVQPLISGQKNKKQTHKHTAQFSCLFSSSLLWTFHTREEFLKYISKTVISMCVFENKERLYIKESRHTRPNIFKSIYQINLCLNGQNSVIKRKCFVKELAIVHYYQAKQNLDTWMNVPNKSKQCVLSGWPHFWWSIILGSYHPSFNWDTIPIREARFNSLSKMTGTHVA